jgi:gliding motility-associated-like protein
MLTGSGVAVFGATLTCPPNASGKFNVVSSSLGFDSGIVLTSGTAVTVGSTIGVNVIDGLTPGASSNFASTDNGAPGDADLTTLAGMTSLDACILEFDFKPAGDSVKFQYVFGSEEYTSYTCTSFNDMFGFLISGGVYATPTNLAKVPGTSIPVCINSVNCGPTGSGSLPTCTALGAGSPFCAYYVNNFASTTSYVTYDGITTVLTALALVNPCDTYHLKLGVADATDRVLDSGVFLKAGSLSSNVTTSITATGTSGLPYCIRGCAPGNFIISRPTPDSTPLVVTYVVSGSAVNGYDYATIGTTITIPTYEDTALLNINPLIVPAVGPKVVTITIMVADPCTGALSPGATANLTILDSFAFRIITPDTAICQGEYVQIIAVGDTLFDSILNYTWTPSATLNDDTVLNPIATPTVTTTYTLTGTTAAILGCAPKSVDVTINVYNPTFTHITGTNPTVCGAANGTITLHGLQTGFPDTVHYIYNGTPQPPLPMVVTPGGTITLTGLCAGIYDSIWVKVGVCSTLVRGPITLVNPAPPTVTVDSPVVNTCVGVSVPLHAFVTPSGASVNYSWAPSTGLSSTTIWNPVVTPPAAGDVTYTVTITPVVSGTPCPGTACERTATVTVHTLGDVILHNPDTAICLGESVQVRITGSNEYTYVWTPTVGVSNPNIKTPIITPTVNTTYSVVASYAHCPNKTRKFFIEVDTAAHPVTISDTICLGMSFTVDLTVPGSTGTGNGYYHYQWTPPGFVSNDTMPNPTITPTVVGTFVYTVTTQPHAVSCAVNNIVSLEVLPNFVNIATPDTAVCFPDSIQIFTTGGHSVFNYQWIPTAGIPNPNTFSPVIHPDTSATYVLTATYYKCPDMVDSIRITVQHTPVVSIGGDHMLCQFDTLHIAANVTPNWQTYKYEWTPSNRLDDTTLASVLFSGDPSVVDTTKVRVIVSTSAGCASSDSATIYMLPGNFASLTPNEKAFCPHEAYTITPMGGVSYSWSPAMYLSSSTSASPVIRPITSQSYNIIATNASGCKDTLVFDAIVHAGGTLYLPDSVIIFPGESYQIDPQTNASFFSWSPAVGLSNPNISNPVAQPAANTRYVVKAVTEHGCEVTDTIYLYVADDALIALPNAFTPGTGANNEFKIIKRGLATLNYFRIFNRWGNLIFETNDIDKGWNGEYKGLPQPFGVYVYEAQVVTKAGKIISKQGNVTLIR